MKTINQLAINYLLKLIELTELAKHKYELVAENEKDIAKKEKFQLLAQKKHEFSVQLQQEVLRLGGNPQIIFSDTLFTCKEFTLKLLENKVVKKYREMLKNSSISDHLRKVATNQLESTQLSF